MVRRAFAIPLAALAAAALPAGARAAAPLRAAADGSASVHAVRAAGPAWLREINRYRAAAGLAAVADQPAWDAGLASHLIYLERTPQRYRTGDYASAHTENPASPFHTESGAREAGYSDLMTGVSPGSSVSEIDGWLAAPFHAVGMLRPNLTEVAFARSVTGAALDVIQGLDQTMPPAGKPVLFPGPGIKTRLTELRGESPDPLETCGWQGARAGLALIALLPAAPASGLSATLAGPRGARYASASGTLCVVDENTFRSSDAVYGPNGAAILAGDHAVFLIPRRPLRGGGYRAVISQPGAADIAWRFTVVGAGRRASRCALRNRRVRIDRHRRVRLRLSCRPRRRPAHGSIRLVELAGHGPVARLARARFECRARGRCVARMRLSRAAYRLARRGGPGRTAGIKVVTVTDAAAGGRRRSVRLFRRPLLPARP